MYCVKCGVNLADTEQVCPLCGTVAYHPDLPRQEGKPLYPTDRMPVQPGRSLAWQGFVTVMCLLAGIIVALCDQQIAGAITWSGFVLGGLAVGYVILVLPAWFRRPNPAIFVPCGFAATILYLLYICLVTDGSWFMGFAFPVAGGIGLIVTATATLLRYLRRGRLFIAGGSAIAMGGFMLLTEFLLNRTFAISHFSGWSIYPLAVLAMMGAWLIFLGICRPAREMMERKFFI